MWWASQAPAQACDDYLTEAGAQGTGSYEWPHELMWWRGDRKRSEQAWGTGRDSREAKESWKQCALWQEELGAMGFAPPGLKRVLRGLGASKEAAGKAFNRMEEMSRKAYHQLWRERCEAQHKAESKRGITPKMKRDRELREGAKTYREAKKEARKQHAEHNPEHDMGTENTDKRNRDAVETPEPNVRSHTPPYDDEEMELANEQEQHQKTRNLQSHQAQTPQDGEEIYFEAQVDAFCWTHAINMSLGSQIVQIKRSLEVAEAYYDEHRHATFNRNGFYEYGVIHHLANLLGTFRIKILSMQDIGLSDDDITRIADEDMIWNRNPNEQDDLLPNRLFENLNAFKDKGIHSLVLTDNRHAVALRYTQGEWYLLDSELWSGPTRMTPDTWARVARYTTAYRVAKAPSETQPAALSTISKRADQATRAASLAANIRNAATNNPIGTPRNTVTQYEDISPERSERTESEQEEGTEDVDEREPEIEEEHENDKIPRPTNREVIGTLMYGVCGRVMGKLCGHGECKVLNGPNKRNCKKCKGKLPNRTVTWQAKGLVMRKREHDRYWAAVCRAGIDGNLGMAGVAEWIHMGWGMGVSPEAGGAGGKGVMRKRARDKGRGILDTSKEKAGVRAPRRKRRKPEPVYTQLEEEPEAEETSRDGRSKRKGDGEINKIKNKKPKKN